MSVTLRVVLDATPLIGKTAGIGAFTRGLINALIEVPDLKVDAYALSFRGFDELGKLLPEGVSHPHIPMPAAALMKTWARTAHPTIDRWVGSFDVVHGTNFVVPPSNRGAMLVTVHDLTAIHYPQLCEPTTLKYPELISKAVSRGAHVHTQSQTIADEVSELLEINPARIHTISPGIPELLELPSGYEDWGKQIAQADRYVLAVGTVEPRKDYPNLVRAFDVVAGDRSDLSLVIAGSIAWGEKELQKAIEEARHSSRIHVLGYVSETQRAALLRGASVFAYPSLYEGFGMAPLEAMQAGVPVVATNAGAVPEVAAGAALYAEVGDPYGLAGVIAQALEDESTRQTLISAGHERVKEFSWTKCASQMADLYELLAKERA